MPLFDEMFIESYAYFFQSIWNNEIIDSLDSGLSRADYYLLIPSDDALSSQWLSYILGFTSHQRKNLLFYLASEPDPETTLPWGDMYNWSVGLEDLRNHLESILPVWENEASAMMATRTLESRLEEHTFQDFALSVEKGDRFMAGVFLEAGFDVNKQSHSNVTLLGLAARKGFLGIARILTAAGADVNQISSDRHNTPLMDAASEGHLDLVRYFVENGADLEVESKSGQTALILAAGNKKTECASLLIDAGADFDIKDNLGLSARKYAELYQMKDLLNRMNGE